MLSLVQNKAALRRVCQKMAEVFTPPKFLKPSEWAETHRRLSPENNAKQHGRWRNYPMQVEPMDSVVDPEVESTVLMWAAQTAGKTEVVNNVVGYFIDQEPSSILVVQPDLNLAETWSQKRFDPMVRDTPILAEIMATRGRGNSTFEKTFPGGYVAIAGANSPASLASRPIRVTIFDEVDRFPESAGKEGDPVDLAERRSETFPNAASVKTSTPTVKGHSRIEKEFDLSDKRYWFVSCPWCKKEQTLKWKQVRWLSDDHLEDAWYQCEYCADGKWNDRVRVSAIKAGRWKATAPFNGVRGYHLNGIYTLLRPKRRYKHRLQQMVAEFLKAKRKGKQSLKVWTNTFLAETWQEEEEVKPQWKPLHDRREPYDPLEGKIPQGVRIITAGIDFQADRCELEFVGHGVGEESWGLGHIPIYGDPRKPELYTSLDNHLNRQFKREDGAILQLDAAGFDTGFAAGQRQLYAYLRPRLGKRYYAFKGSSIRNAEPISHSAKKTKVEWVRLIMVGTNRIKTYLYNRATILEPGPGYMHFPSRYTIEWFKQFLAEEWKTVVENGQSFRVFTMPEALQEDSTNRNEALDMRVYAQAALYARGVPNWEFEERKNLRTIVEIVEENVAEPQKHTQKIASVLRTNPTPIRRRPRSGLLSGILR